jgi:hypothetical protein
VHLQPGGDSHAKHHNHEHGLSSKHKHTSHSADERAADVARQRDQSHHEGQRTHSTFYMLPGYDHVVLPLRPGTKITLEWEEETKKTYEATVDTVKKAEGRVRAPPRLSLRRLQTSGPIIEVSQAFFDLRASLFSIPAVEGHSGILCVANRSLHLHFAAFSSDIQTTLDHHSRNKKSFGTNFCASLMLQKRLSRLVLD